MSNGLKYGDVALGVEAALPAFHPARRPGFGYARFRRALIWLFGALRRWA